MTPTEQEIEFFTSEEAKRIQEEWEPKLGDFYLCEGEVCIVERHRFRWFEDDVWLPRQGQLQAMLEKRGCDNWELERDGQNYEFTYPSLHEHLVVVGPTPSIALGGALIKVMNE